MNQRPNPAINPDTAALCRLSCSLEITMRFLCAFLFIALASVDICAATFAERVAIAKEIEAQEAFSTYFFKSLFPAIGPTIGGMMKHCLSLPDASKERFTLVANVTQEGVLTDIDFEPKSNNTGACFAKAFATLTAPPPPLCDCGVLPMVIDMKVEP